jgi:hypothetical protein
MVMSRHEVARTGSVLLPDGKRDAPAGRSSRRPAFWPANCIAKLRKLWGTLSIAAIARGLSRDWGATRVDADQ